MLENTFIQKTAAGRAQQASGLNVSFKTYIHRLFEKTENKRKRCLR